MNVCDLLAALMQPHIPPTATVIIRTVTDRDDPHGLQTEMLVAVDANQGYCNLYAASTRDTKYAAPAQPT